MLVQSPSSLGTVEPVPALRTRITHTPSGEFIEDVMLLMLDKQNAQGLGGAITYGRRYAVTSMLGLVTEVDDDGNAASAQPERKKPATAVKARTAAKPAAGGDDDW